MTKTNLCKAFGLWAAACCLSLLFAVQTKAQLLDPSTLHIGSGAGTGCATGCGGDPNLILGNTVDIFNQSGGSPQTEVPPVLLILGIPNTTGNIAALLPTGVTFINPYPGGSTTFGSAATATAGTFGLKSAVSGNYFGNMTAGQEVYGFLTLTGPVNNSNSFTNWSGADLTINGITATGFGIYVFALSSTANLGPMGLINMTLAGLPLPKGIFVVAYGQSAIGVPNAVPFTESGLTVIPEPGSMALFGTSLLALGGVLRRRWHRHV